MNYEKITKWSLIAMLLVGVFLSVYGFIVGWPTEEQKWDESLHFPVDLILWGGYIFAAITALSVVFGVVVIGGMNNPKSLLKLGIVIVAAVVLVLIAYLLASGDCPQGYTPPVDVTPEDMKSTYVLTDTILNLAYYLAGGSVLALLASWVIGLTRK